LRIRASRNNIGDARPNAAKIWHAMMPPDHGEIGGSMLSRWKGLARAAGLLSVLGLSGCMLADAFSDRVIEYNLQAEQAQEQELLLNIVRASLRRPMQFTGLQEITGNAQATGSGTFSVPFGHHPRPNPGTFGLTSSFSGGPQFQVPVFDTQEFYQGILAPITLDVFDYYLQQGFPRELLYDLFVAKLVIARQDGTEFTFDNSALNDFQRQQFHIILEYLLAAGLTTEHADTSSEVGPPIPEADLKAGNPEQMARLLDSYAKASSEGLRIKQVGKDGKISFSVTKSKSGARFCFTRHGSALDRWLNHPAPSLYCGNENLNSGVPEDGVAQFPKLTLNDDIFAALDKLQTAETARLAANGGTLNPEDAVRISLFKGQSIALKLYVRSTQGIMYYLGEVVRRDLHPELYGGGGTARVLQIKTTIPFGAVPAAECPETGVTEAESAVTPFLPGIETSQSYLCENLFRVDTTFGSPSPFIQVDYDDATYSLSRDPRSYGRSYEVMELVKQLFALNTSAKQFPSTNVFTIVSPP
jgi:hypothetical protein